MKKQVVVIHGGDAFNTYEEYLEDLKSVTLNLERLRSRGWKSSFQEKLGDEYDVLIPDMPNKMNAKYLEWKIWFEKLIPLMDEKVAFIGHSLGGIFLAKYLSENSFPKTIKATFLIATPYNTTNNHPLADFVISEQLEGLEKQAGKLFIYHSKDDPVVPFEDLQKYVIALPKAQAKIFEDRKHFNQPEFPELVENIKTLDN